MTATTRRAAILAMLATLAPPLLVGCPSPEDGRPRGGGRGGDGGNYPPDNVIRPPSKLDGTRTWTARPKA